MRTVRYFCGEVSAVMGGNIGKDYFTVTLSAFSFLRVIGDRIDAFDMQIAPLKSGPQLDLSPPYRNAAASADGVVQQIRENTAHMRLRNAAVLGHDDIRFQNNIRAVAFLFLLGQHGVDYGIRRALIPSLTTPSWRAAKAASHTFYFSLEGAFSADQQIA